MTLSYTGRVYTNGVARSQQLLRQVGALSKQLSTENYGRPGVQPLAMLDVYSEDDIPEDLFPNTEYPSDHISIAADFEIIW